MITQRLTPYAEVDAVLHRLLDNVQPILGADLFGMYLFGSLSSGDFDLHRSDIDFVAVTRDILPPDRINALEAMHQRLFASDLPLITRLEGVYLPLADLRCYEPDQGPYPNINEGHFSLSGTGSDWIIQRHIVREHGVIVTGPDPRPWIDPVAPDDLRRAAAATLDEWWGPVLRNNPAWLADRIDYRAFAVETMCRVLYTVQHGAVGSKRVSAEWALTTLEDRWHPLIRAARAWSHVADLTQLGVLDAAPDFIAYTLARVAEEKN